MFNLKGEFTGTDLKIYLVNQFMEAQRGLSFYMKRIDSYNADERETDRIECHRLRQIFREYYGRRQMCLDICREFFYTEFSASGVEKVIDMIDNDEPVFTWSAVDLVFGNNRE